MRNNTKNAENRDGLLLAAFLLSGFSGLGYELVWTKLLGLSLGCETLAVYGVLAGYFGGMSYGAFLFSRKIRSARQPALWYVVFEIVIAVYALILPFILIKMPAFMPVLLGGVVAENTSAMGLFFSLVIAGLIFLPATVCIGATLPALVEARKRSIPADNEGRGLGRLYGANTLGATAGIAVTVYALLPRLGMLYSSVILVVCTLGAALCAFIWQRKCAERVADKPEKAQAGEEKGKHEDILLLSILFGLGFAGIAYEVVGIQILSQIFRNTIYTFANILGVFLVGTALGAWLYSISIKRIRYEYFSVLVIMLVCLGVSVFLSAFPLVQSFRILQALAPLSGSSYMRHLFGEVTLACAIFLVPTICMGVLFSHITSRFTAAGIGRAVAINTLGATLAPLLFALVFINTLGYTGSFYLVAGTYFILFVFCILIWKPKLSITVIGLGLLLVTGLIAPKNLTILFNRENEREIKRYEGIMGQVMVVEKKSGSKSGSEYRFLKVDRYYQMGGGDAQIEHRQGLLPLFFTSGKGRILYLGVGTGVFVDAARSFDFDTIDAVEIVPQVLKVLPYFSAINNDLDNAGNVNLYNSDARRFVWASKNSYEVIFGDLFHPSRPGASYLFTVEHFRAIRLRLKDKGIFLQYVPLYQYDTATLKMVMRTFSSVFPKCHALLGRFGARNVMVLVGVNNDVNDLSITINTVQERLVNSPKINQAIPNIVDLFAGYLLDGEGIRKYAGEGKLNTDLHPRIMFTVPKLAYESIPGDRVASLSSLLDKKMTISQDLVTETTGASLRTFFMETDYYSKALISFLRAEILMKISVRTNIIEEKAIDLYVQAYELNPTFAMSRGMPFTLSPFLDKYHDKIFSRLIAATPGLKWLYIDYLKILKNRLHDEEQFRKVFNQSVPVFGSADSLMMILESSGGNYR